jgi:hypothetical protein
VALRLGLGQVHRRWPGPVALAEIGASAGLNPLFDRYDYRLGERRPAPAPRSGRSRPSAGSDASAVVIGCEVRGAGPGDRVLGAGGLPGDEPVVVFTASLLSYLDAGARTAFADQLARAARKRPVAWVFAEGPGLVATMNLASYEQADERDEAERGAAWGG